MLSKNRIKNIEKELNEKKNDELIIVFQTEEGFEFRSKLYATIAELKEDTGIKSNRILTLDKIEAEKYDIAQ